MSVRGLLDGQLRPYRRVADLEALAATAAAGPLTDTVRDLRVVLASRRIGGEDHRRLQVLISTLYHEAGAALPLVNDLRAEVDAALTVGRTLAPVTTATQHDEGR